MRTDCNRGLADILMLLTNGFHPDPRVHKEAVSLTKNGFQVTLVCMDRGGDLPPREVVDGIDVRRVRVGKVRPGEILSVGRALAEFHARAAWEVWALGGRGRFGAIHCNDFDTVALGLALRLRYGIPVVYDMHDQYSSFFTSPAARRVVDSVDARYCRHADATIVVNDRFLSLPYVDARKSTVIMNVPTAEGGGRSEDTGEGILCAGNLDRSRDVRYAMGALAAAGCPIRFAGDGPLLDETRARATSGDIAFLGRIPPKEVIARTQRSRAVLALYDPAYPNNRLASPNKLFDAMKFGKPAVVSDGTVMADIVRRFDCGLAVTYGDAASLALALGTLMDEGAYRRLCANAFRAFQSDFNWGIMEPRLVSLYTSLLAPGAHGARGSGGCTV